MMYIPTNWLKKKENEKEVCELMANRNGCFQSAEDERKIELKLRELGEDKILEEFKNGTFAM